MAQRIPGINFDGITPERGDCYSSSCPAREVLGHVTGRWGGLVLGALTNGTRRYSELRTRIDGISEKMLAQTLRDLERDGLVIRRQYPSVPPRVDYTLTPGGMEVAQRVNSLIGWLQDHVHELVTAQKQHEATQASQRQDTA
jgi:DNA-binding HxlR family transcriptional regulator